MSETSKQPERSKSAKPRSKPRPKALPVARVVAAPVKATEPEHWRKRLQGHRKRPWLATSAICVTVLLIPLMIWWSGREEQRQTERVADAGPAPVLAKADEDVRHGPSPPEIISAERSADAEIVSTDATAPDDPPTTNTIEEDAADVLDVGALDLALLTALDPEPISETGRFGETIAGVRVLALGDGVLAAGGEDGTIRLWDVASQRLSHELSGHTAGIHCLAFSADGTKIASGSDDRTIRLWDTATGSETRQFTGHRQAVSGVAFAPDGRSIYSIGTEGTLKRWDVATGQTVQSLDGGTGFAKLAISPAGDAILVGDWGGGVHLWDGTSPQWTNLAQSTDGGDGIPIAAGPAGPVDGPVGLHAAAIGYLHVDGEGNVISADETGETVVFWNLATGEEVGRFATNGPIVGHVPTAEGTILLAAHRDGTIRVWDPATESVTHRLIGHEGPIVALVRSPSGELAVTAGSDGTLRLWSLSMVQPLPGGEQ